MTSSHAAKHAREPERTLTPMEAMLYESMSARLDNVRRTAQRRYGYQRQDYRGQEHELLSSLAEQLGKYQY